MSFDFLSKNFIDEKIHHACPTGKKCDVLPEANVIIVTYQANDDLLANLSALEKQTFNKFEVLIIDNNHDNKIESIISKYHLKISYIKMNRNDGLCIGRNVGIAYSTADLLIFLDDDAVPASNFVEQHVAVHQDQHIVAVRGKSKPKTMKFWNLFAMHYDLGSKVIPSFIDLEGNSSFKKEFFEKVGGWDIDLSSHGGHEGILLTRKGLQLFNDKTKFIYCPDAVIYHNYSNSFEEFILKIKRHYRVMNRNKEIIINMMELFDRKKSKSIVRKIFSWSF